MILHARSPRRMEPTLLLVHDPRIAKRTQMTHNPDSLETALPVATVAIAFVLLRPAAGAEGESAGERWRT